MNDLPAIFAGSLLDLYLIFIGSLSDFYDASF